MSNPNGLTDEQIAARPAIDVGTIYWRGSARGWASIRSKQDINFHRVAIQNHHILPGEVSETHGPCPWPPPPEFRHDWKEGDRAWVLHNGRWREAAVIHDLFQLSMPNDAWLPITTPALYIPKENER